MLPPGNLLFARLELPYQTLNAMTGAFEMKFELHNINGCSRKSASQRGSFVVEFCPGRTLMKRLPWVCLLLLGFSPLAASAQQSDSDKALNSTQKLGQRIFQQRCGVCHSQIGNFPMYGPALHKDLINGNEDAIKEMIRSGTSKMPGFKFGLQPAEIDAIVEYLKTVPKPEKRTAPTSTPMGPVD
jgi:mono/diheme cytochrome c family protein